MAQLPAIAQSEREQSEAVTAFAQEIGKLKTWFRTRTADGVRAVGAQQPFYLAYVPGNHREVLGQYGHLCASLMSAWATKVGVPPVSTASRAGGKLRIGVVSAHIHSHSVWHAILRGWVQYLDRSEFELHIFHTGTRRDAETEWAARHASHLHANLGDWTAWAKAISDLRLDVLVYPEIGMDATTVRLSALRLARVQLASWGHPITTGLPTIDAYISAQAFEPAEAASHYTERLIALPRLGCAYRPYDTRPEKVDLALWGIGPGDRVLVCAGNSFKYVPGDDALWVEVARRCRPCKLLFFRADGDARAAALEGRLRKAFEAGGLAFDDFVRFIPWQPHGAFFGLLQRADVFLDSVGFSGFNTAMQAVQCGTPVVAWEGEFMRGRFASGILRQLGLQEWVADSAEDFARRAEMLCGDPQLRRTVRDRISIGSASLYDDRASVDALAAALRELARP